MSATPICPMADGQVRLRAWRTADVQALALLCRDPEIQRWTSVPGDYTIDHAAARLAWIEREQLAGHGRYLAIVDEQNGVLLGACDVHISPADPGIGEIGYLLGAPARGRGAMTGAVKLIVGWCLRERKLARLEILVHPDNHPSIAVAERAGFHREGLLRGYREKHGRREDRIVFSLVPGDLTGRVDVSSLPGKDSARLTE
ncbi:MAG TPA: GNAT family protein [Solirubrobacteraceae bacterium]